LLSGDGGHDIIFGGQGRDIIINAAGATIYGGEGKDVLLLDGTFDDYTVDFSHGSIKFTNAAGVTETIRSVEQFGFSGDHSTYVVKHHALVQADLADRIQQLLASFQSQGTTTSSKASVSTAAASTASAHTTTTEAQLTELRELDLSSGTIDTTGTTSQPTASAHQTAHELYLSAIAHHVANDHSHVHHSVDHLFG